MFSQRSVGSGDAATPAHKGNPDHAGFSRSNKRYSGLLQEVVAFLRAESVRLREEWCNRILATGLLKVMTKEEILAQVTSVYDQYIDAVDSGKVDVIERYAENLSQIINPWGVEVHEAVGSMLLLRDVLTGALLSKYGDDPAKLRMALDAYEPSGNRVLMAAGVGFVKARERVIQEQQKAIRELSTPVLQVRDRLLILPIIGLIDPPRSRQLTEQLLHAIRAQRAKVVVIDITGVPVMDSNDANLLVQTVEAAKLLGASVIVTGLSPEIAQTLVRLGVDLSKMQTIGDLQGGIEEANRILGYKVVPTNEGAQ